MEFHSLRFFAFLAAVLALHHVLPLRARRWLLLVASYVFYGGWDWRFCFLIAASTVLDWWLALRIERTADPRARRRWLTVSIVANLSILGFFKYADFGIASCCALLGLDEAPLLLHVVLPVGVSFFTFQSLSYTIDVYRQHIAARQSLVDFAVFVAFFPQLVAGPIVKAVEFFPDFDRWRGPSDRELQRALMLILLGLVEKACIADHLAPYVDGYFRDPASAPGLLGAITGTAAFGLQIFFDFTGYSDIAIGTALLFGYRFPENFRRPYLAANLAEFWHRWHISLSTWLREYLYISLGGNRHGTARTLRNLMLTMLLGGLWHGANWTFVVWGGLHGGGLVVHRLWRARVRPLLSDRVLSHPAYGIACWAATMYAVGLAWVFFRAPTVAAAWPIARELLWPSSLGTSVLPTQWAAILAGALGIALLQERGNLLDRIDSAHWLWRGVVFALLAHTLTCFVATDQHTAFLYFQF